MRTRLGSFLFIFAFIISALIVSLIERIPRLLDRTVQSLSLVREKWVRSVAKRISMAEGKNAAQKAS